MRVALTLFAATTSALAFSPPQPHFSLRAAAPGRICTKLGGRGAAFPLGLPGVLRAIAGDGMAGQTAAPPSITRATPDDRKVPSRKTPDHIGCQKRQVDRCLLKREREENE